MKRDSPALFPPLMIPSASLVPTVEVLLLQGPGLAGT